MYEAHTLTEQESPFHDLFIRYGRLVKEKMRSARSREETKRFTEETCRTFDHQCKIEVIRKQFKKYVFEIYRKYWATGSKYSKTSLEMFRQK